LGWYRGFADVQDAVRVVGLDEIKAEDWTLNISRYVLPPLQEDIPPLPDAIAAFKDALTRCREAEERLAQVMAEGGWLKRDTQVNASANKNPNATCGAPPRWRAASSTPAINSRSSSRCFSTSACRTWGRRTSKP